jgi:hypothetical protein
MADNNQQAGAQGTYHTGANDMTDTQQTIAAYRKEQQRRQQIEGLIGNVLMGILGAHVFAAVAYALFK